jgi:LysR family transcriptional regulator, transcriptional activator for dmlA
LLSYLSTIIFYRRTLMNANLLASDLLFFSSLATAGSLSAAARELKVTTAAVSKRLSLMEARLATNLINRTTRRMSLTVEGETCLRHARKLQADLADLAQELGTSHTEPSGLLRVNATLGFGRSRIAPIVAQFAQRFPKVEVRLQLSADPPALLDDAFDVCIRFGPPPDARVIARKLADNRRLLCAAPSYLAKHGTPRAPLDLATHNFISIRQGDEAYGVLRLTQGKPATKTHAQAEVIKTRGNLTTNDGGIAVHWALQGLGVLLRAEWDVRPFLQNGQLVHLLPKYQTPDANIYAIYPPQHNTSARVREFVNLAQQVLAKNAME